MQCVLDSIRSTAGSFTHSVSKSRPGILQDTVKSASVSNSLQGLHNFLAMRDLTKIGCNADGCRNASCSFDCLFTLLAWYIDAGVQNNILWLLEAMGSAVLDFPVVCQVFYFRTNNKYYPEAAALLCGI